VDVLAALIIVPLLLNGNACFRMSLHHFSIDLEGDYKCIVETLEVVPGA
jgi:hypothetical protein